MQCNRCGETAVVKRAETFFCGKCALTRDWQEIIDLVQDGRVEVPVAGLDDDAEIAVVSHSSAVDPSRN
ncbi:hypothetical protein HQ535_07200 [bacterium]|nr:hypothetical protein [bacterium]